MKRALPLLLALAGCATAGRVAHLEARVASLEAGLPKWDETPAAQLGGPGASAPIASVGAWVPVQSARQTLLAGLGGPGLAGTSTTTLPSLTVAGALSVGGTSTLGGTSINGLTVTNFLVHTGILYLRGAAASSYLTNDTALLPVFVNDLEGLCVGDLTGTNCDGTVQTNSYAFGNCAGCTISSDGSNVSVGTGMTTAGTVYAPNIGVTSGNLYLYATDSTAAPGAATINKPMGKSAVASGAASVVITNSKVSDANAVVILTPLSDSNADNKCRGGYVSTIATGSFTVTCPGGATAADWKFSWQVLNKGD